MLRSMVLTPVVQTKIEAYGSSLTDSASMHHRSLSSCDSGRPPPMRFLAEPDKVDSGQSPRHLLCKVHFTKIYLALSITRSFSMGSWTQT
jgi:hypothetical protein